MTAGGKSGDPKGDPKRAERLKAALRDNLKRRKAQVRGREGLTAKENASPRGTAPAESPAEAGKEQKTR